MNTINQNLENTIYSKSSIATATINQFVYDVKRNEERNDYWSNVLIVKDALSGKISYAQGLLLHDLIYSSYHSINKDIQENRISKEEVCDFIDRCNSIREVFNKTDIMNNLK